MANCTGCGTSDSSVLRPNLSCPPDLSQLLFRFIERKSLGIIKGTTTISSIDMSNFFLPLGNYMQGNILLCGDTPKRIEAPSYMDFGKRREITVFNIAVPGVIFDPGATAQITIEGTGLAEVQLEGIAADTYTDFITNLKAAIAASTTVAPKIEFHEDNSVDTFSLRGKTYGDGFTYELVFSTDPENGLSGDVTQTKERYPEGAWKLIFLNIIFCAPCAASNKQVIEYAYDADYQAKPSSATWYKAGPVLLLTGGEDLLETDTNKIETLWLRTVGDCDVEIQTILGI